MIKEKLIKKALARIITAKNLLCNLKSCREEYEMLILIVEKLEWKKIYLSTSPK